MHELRKIWARFCRKYMEKVQELPDRGVPTPIGQVAKEK